MVRSSSDPGYRFLRPKTEVWILYRLLIFFEIIKLNKYKLTEYSTEASEFLIYGKDNFEIPKEIKEIELVQENLNKAELDANFDLVLYEYTDFMILFLPFKGKQKRTRDKILFDAGVVSWEI